MQDMFAALTVNDLINENTRSWNLNIQSAILNDQLRYYKQLENPSLRYTATDQRIWNLHSKNSI